MTIPFLNHAADTIDQYTDTYLPSHQLSIRLLREKIIPKIEEFIKWERKFTHVNKIIWWINLWILIGIYIGTVSMEPTNFLFYFLVGLFATINIDLMTQQIKLYRAKYYMKRACLNYTTYMAQREYSKEAINEFLNHIEKIVDSVPNDNNNNNGEPPNGRSD